MSELPNSYTEKASRTPEYFEHWMYVHELIRLLKQLKPDDVLTPNNVHNLAVHHEDGTFIAAINFFFNCIDYFDGRDAYMLEENRK